jgi:outer membrane usher protein
VAGLSLGVLLSLAALPPWPAAAQEGQPAVLSLIVNHVERGDIIVLLKPGDVLVRVEDLEQAGLRGVGGPQETVGGATYVSVASLAPGLTFDLDERALVLRLTAQPALLPSTVLDLQVVRPPGLVYREDTSAFLNYAIQAVDFKRYALFTEAGLRIKSALLFSSASRNEDGTFVRGLSNITVDDRDRLVRWTLGDFVPRSADPLSGSLLMGGLNVSREFSIDPYFVTYPMLNLSGVVATPATADVYVNGLLLRRTALPPGSFELRNLQVPAGSGTARVVIRDAFGREQVIPSSFYFTPRLLAKGLQEYSYSLGARRDNFGTESWDYSRLGFLGQHRVGLTDAFTVGGRLEAAGDLVSGGPTLTAGLPVGEIDLAAGASRQGAFSGAAGSLVYRYSARQVSFGAAVRALTDRYATFQLAPEDDRARLETSVFAGAQLGPRTALTVQYTRAQLRDEGARDRASAFLNIRLTDRLSLLLSGSRSSQDRGPATNEGFVLLSVFLGERTTGAISYQRSGSRNTGLVEVQRSLPVGTGFGYRVQASTTETTPQGNLTLQYQGPWGRYEATYQNTAGTGSTTLSAAGGIAAIGGVVFATRPVADSFALIRVPGVEGVRGYLNNQEVGTTNVRGDLPVPDLLAYYGNRLGIADTDIPLEYSVAEKERTVATPFRGGAIISFPVQLIRAITGHVTMTIAGQRLVPAFGQLTVTADGRPFDSPIGREGEFYLDTVPAGRHPAVIEHEKGRCSFTLDVPAAAAPVIDLGALRCDVP